MPFLFRASATGVLLVALGAASAGCGAPAAPTGSRPSAGLTAATGPTTSPTSAPATSGAATPGISAPPSPTVIVDAAQVVTVDYRDGEVTGGGRVEVRRDSEVLLRVTSDVADEVHVHGYDQEANVSPTRPAEIRFTADLPGVFEVELEELGKQLLRLQVR